MDVNDANRPPTGPEPPPPAPPGRPVGGPGPAPGLEYATFGGRLIAYVIDAVIVGLATGAIAALSGVGLLGFYGLGGFGGLGGLGGPFDLRSILDVGFGRIVFAFIAAIISGLYFVYFWTRNAATPGQSFLALEVRNAADGARLTQDQAIRRWAFLTVPFVSVFPLVGLLVFVYQLFLAYTTYEDPAHQGFHDKEARTVVVRRLP